MRYSNTVNRIAALATEQSAVLGYCRSLSPEEWALPSGCAGWTVKDVVAHMAAGYHGPFQLSWVRRLLKTDIAEQAAEIDVAARRDDTPAEILAEFATWGRRFLSIQGALGRIPRLAWSLKMPAADLGTYPIGSVVSAFVFDHHTHLRHDIAPAIGRSAAPPGPDCMTVTVEWMMAGLEQMCRNNMTWVDRPLSFILDGPGGGRWSIEQAGGGVLSVREGNAIEAAATIHAEADEFPLWGTTRKPWRDCAVSVSGDNEYAAKFLDSMNII